jgi:hypothetical protein
MNEILTNHPELILGLAAIGLATVFYLCLQILKPVFGYLFANNNHLCVFWCSLMIVIGSVFIGLGEDFKLKSHLVGGMALTSCGVAIMLIYWLRKWVKWGFLEKDE